METVGLLGGSFNPVHMGHMQMAQAALDSGRVDRVLLLPSGNPPHKRDGLAPAADRLHMVRLAAAGCDGIGVCTEEMERPGVIYTVDTLRALHSRMPDARFAYLIGADTLFALRTWRQIDTVISLCSFLAVRRGGGDEAMLREAESWRGRGADIALIDMPQVAISSTQVRSRIESGLPLTGFVPSGVEAYILARGLYGARKTGDVG